MVPPSESGNTARIIVMDLPNPNRIDLADPANVLLWADLLAIPVERLHEIAARVGPMAAAVRFYAAKTEGESRPARVESVIELAQPARTR